jgi:histidine ammonia-lyase
MPQRISAGVRTPAMVLLAAAQAVDLRGGSKGLGSGSRRIYGCIRQVAQFQDKGRPMEQEVAALALKISDGALRF